jgi:hypothetical protein
MVSRRGAGGAHLGGFEATAVSDRAAREGEGYWGPKVQKTRKPSHMAWFWAGCGLDGPYGLL